MLRKWQPSNFQQQLLALSRTRTGQVLTFAIKVGAHRRQNPQRLGLDAPRHSRRKRSDGTCRCPRRQRNSSQYALFVYIWYSVNQLVHDHNHNHIFTHCHLSWYWFDFIVFLSSLKPLLRLTWSSWCLPQVSARGRCPSPPYQWLRWVISWHFSSSSAGGKGQGQIEHSQKTHQWLHLLGKGFLVWLVQGGEPHFSFSPDLGIPPWATPRCQWSGWSQSKTERYVAWACEMVEALRQMRGEAS